MKYQSSLISYILLGVVIVGIAIGVYNWGVPMLQKSQMNTVISGINSQFSTLAEDIYSVGSTRSSKTTTLSLPTGTFTISSNKIVFTFSSPVTYYNPNIPVIPINYGFFISCTSNLTVNPGQTINLCGLPYIKAYHNGSYIILTDMNNVSIQLPLTNINDIITSAYVFNMIVNGSTVTFIPLYNSGIEGVTYFPPCIVSASQTENIIEYKVSCRPLYDIDTKVCKWYIIKPVGQTSSTGGNFRLSLQYNTEEISPTQYSTVCNQIHKIYIGVSII